MAVSRVQFPCGFFASHSRSSGSERSTSLSTSSGGYACGAAVTTAAEKAAAASVDGRTMVSREAEGWLSEDRVRKRTRATSKVRYIKRIGIAVQHQGSTRRRRRRPRRRGGESTYCNKKGNPNPHSNPCRPEEEAKSGDQRRHVATGDAGEGDRRLE
jgi:hypothetical protein